MSERGTVVLSREDGEGPRDSSPSSRLGMTHASAAQGRGEGLIFEHSRPGRRGYKLPPLDVPEEHDLPAALLRGAIEGEVEVSEVGVNRHWLPHQGLNRYR